MSGTVKAFSEAELDEKAKENGCELFLPLDDELTIDLDDGAVLNERVLEIVETTFGVSSRLETISKSGNGKHVYIRLCRTPTPTERVLMQACLGSDPVREALSLLRLRTNDSHPYSVTFETPAEADKVRKWRTPFDDEMPF